MVICTYLTYSRCAVSATRPTPWRWPTSSEGRANLLAFSISGLTTTRILVGTMRNKMICSYRLSSPKDFASYKSFGPIYPCRYQNSFQKCTLQAANIFLHQLILFIAYFFYSADFPHFIWIFWFLKLSLPPVSPISVWSDPTIFASDKQFPSLAVFFKLDIFHHPSNMLSLC